MQHITKGTQCNCWQSVIKTDLYTIVNRRQMRDAMTLRVACGRLHTSWVFSLFLKVVTSLAHLQLLGSEFQTTGVTEHYAFADRVFENQGSNSKFL